MLPTFAPPPSAAVQPLAPGQRRACLSKQPGRKLFVVVSKLETLGAGPTAHVSVFDETPGATLPQVGHAPFDAHVLATSCPTVVGSGQLGSEFDNGYAEWKSAQGGVFTISVEEALDISTQMLTQSDKKC